MFAVSIQLIKFLPVGTDSRDEALGHQRPTMSQGPPEDPHSRSDFAVLSPASPKPLHLPTPTNIPVRDTMMDIGSIRAIW